MRCVRGHLTGVRLAFRIGPSLIAIVPVSPLEPVRIERISEEAYQCKERIVYLRRSDIDKLKRDVPLTRRKRIRILIHPGTDHPLHEMLVVYTNATYVRPNLHIGK